MKDLKLIYKEILLYQNGDIGSVDFWKNIDKIQLESKTLHNIKIN
tara:strand:- start:403 stop:537 length:135 start_codon:yes stop_codon:yes gene_type:complete